MATIDEQAREIHDRVFALWSGPSALTEDARLHAKREAARAAIQFLERARAKEKARPSYWDTLIDSLDILVATLREGGEERGMFVQIAPKGTLFEIKRGPDKGSKRAWRVSFERPVELKRKRKSPEERLAKLLGD